MFIESIESIVIEDLVITIVRKKIKNLYIKIKPPLGEVLVTAPHRTSINKIKQFIELKYPWIQKQQIKIKQQEYQKYITDHNFETGDQIEFQGDRYTLNLIYNKGVNKVMIGPDLDPDLDSTHKIFNLYVAKRGVVSLRQNIVNNFYKNILDQQLLILIPKWENIIGVKINNYKIRNMRSRWGSCKIDEKIICLNLQLARSSPICLEYVLVHELVHLLEKSHNKRFYNLMTKFMPNWKDYEKILNLTLLK